LIPDYTAAARVARRTAKNADLLANINNLSPHTYLTMATDLGLLWMRGQLPGYTAIVAYKALKYSHITDVRLPAVRLAVLRLLCLTRSYHPLERDYRDAPEAERQAALDELAAAVDPLMPPVMTADFLRSSDALRLRLAERIDEAHRAAEAARAAAARAAFAERLRAEPVVFQRDPEGSVDLRAFAADAQSVHRSSVQSATERSVRLLMERAVPAEQDTIAGVTAAFLTPAIVRWDTDAGRDHALHEVATNYMDTVAFSVRYGDVMDRVWAYLQSHAEKAELIVRLAQEVTEGIGMCSNGKMARLVNVLQGYDESLFTEPPKEAFQEKIARLRTKPAEERAPAAALLFEEYRIPEEERGAWREALEE